MKLLEGKSTPSSLAQVAESEKESLKFLQNTVPTWHLRIVHPWNRHKLWKRIECLGHQSQRIPIQRSRFQRSANLRGCCFGRIWNRGYIDQQRRSTKDNLLMRNLRSGFRPSNQRKFEIGFQYDQSHSKNVLKQRAGSIINISSVVWSFRKCRSNQLCRFQSRRHWIHQIGSLGIGFKKYSLQRHCSRIYRD